MFGIKVKIGKPKLSIKSLGISGKAANSLFSGIKKAGAKVVSNNLIQLGTHQYNVKQWQDKTKTEARRAERLTKKASDVLSPVVKVATAGVVDPSSDKPLKLPTEIGKNSLASDILTPITKVATGGLVNLKDDKPIASSISPSKMITSVLDGMTGGFMDKTKPKPPTMPSTPAAPDADDVAKSADVSLAERLRRRQGRASTILTSGYVGSKASRRRLFEG